MRFEFTNERDAVRNRRDIVPRSNSIVDLINPESLYPAELSLDQLYELYRVSGMAQRVVRLFPRYCWAHDLVVYEDLESSDTLFEKKYKALSDRLKFPYYFKKLDVLTGIGRYGLLYIGFADGLDSNVPVANARDIVFLRAFSEQQVTIDQWETDINSPRYGLPVMYKLRFQSEMNNDTQELLVHESRTIHVAETNDESEVFGQPRVSSVQFRVLDIERILGGSAGMFWRGGISGYAFTADSEGQVVDEEKIKESIEQFVSGLNRYFWAQGVTTHSLTQQIADPVPHFEAQIKYMAAALDVPYRFLIGSEEAKYASTQDRQSFYDQVAERQTQFCIPQIVTPFIEKLIAVNVLPQPKEFGVEFPQPTVDSVKEKRETSILLAEAISGYHRGLHLLMDFESYLKNVLDLEEDTVDALVTSYNTIQGIRKLTKTFEDVV